MSSATVLIVEDEDSLRDTLSRFMTREGYSVIAAANGRQALDEAVAHCPDVLIADWMLQNHLHGLHVSEAFRAINPELNTILITGFPSDDLLEESDRCGVLQLLEKPFDLADLQDAVSRALVTAAPDEGRSRPVAVVDLDAKGAIRFASARARELFAHVVGEGVPVAHLESALGQGIVGRLPEAESEEWIRVALPSESGASGEHWLLRARQRATDGGWLVVICPEQEHGRISDPRIRILLDHRSGPSPILPDHGTVVVIERDGAVRRLLVSQLERIGALCYPTDDLTAALRLLQAEPQVPTVLIDFALAGAAMTDWVAAIKRARPDVTVIGMGGSGSEDELLAQGVARVLFKPWRIMDLLDVIAH